jgi:hypothetical protein
MVSKASLYDIMIRYVTICDLAQVIKARCHAKDLIAADLGGRCRVTSGIEGRSPATTAKDAERRRNDDRRGSIWHGLTLTDPGQSIAPQFNKPASRAHS